MMAAMMKPTAIQTEIKMNLLAIRTVAYLMYAAAAYIEIQNSPGTPRANPSAISTFPRHFGCHFSAILPWPQAPRPFRFALPAESAGCLPSPGSLLNNSKSAG